MKAGRLAWVMLAACVGMGTAGVVLLSQVPAETLEPEGYSFLLSVAFFSVSLVFGLVGAVVSSRMPTNPIGWLFLGLALIESAYEFAYGYTHYSLGVAELPGTIWTAWFAAWSSTASPALIGLAFLLFPNGRLLSRRWRPVGWLCVLAALTVMLMAALTPGAIYEFPSLLNPLGVERAAFLRDVSPAPLFVAILICAVSAVVVRFRRSHGVERQQLKWFAWAAGLVVGFLPVGPLWEAAAGGSNEGVEYAAGFVFAVILCGLPVSAGIAILRYRLYDIDVVIKRTLVYGALTAVLLATYLGSVLVFRLALDPLMGDSDLAVAASTLGVAALFRPLRGRIQAVVDRRFYRRRYDAARTLDGFAGRLREELDLEALVVDLRRAVHETMQPSHVSLWLRGTV